MAEGQAMRRIIGEGMHSTYDSTVKDLSSRFLASEVN